MEISREYISAHFAPGSDVREAYDQIAGLDGDPTTLTRDEFEVVPTAVARRFSDHHGDGALVVLRAVLAKPEIVVTQNALNAERWIAMTPRQRTALLRTSMNEGPSSQLAMLGVLNAAYSQLLACDVGDRSVIERTAGSWYLGLPIELVVAAPPPGPLPSAFYRGTESGTFRYLPSRFTGELTAAVAGGITTSSFESFLVHALSHIRRSSADVISLTDHGAPGVQTFGDSNIVLTNATSDMSLEFRLRQLALLAPLFAPSGRFELGGCEVGAQAKGLALLTSVSRSLPCVRVNAGLLLQLPWWPGFEGSVLTCESTNGHTGCIVE